MYHHPFRLLSLSTREKRLLRRESNKDAPYSEPPIDGAEKPAETEDQRIDRELIDTFRERLAKKIKEARGTSADILDTLREALADDGKLVFKELSTIANSIYRKFFTEVGKDIQERMDDVLPTTESDMISLLIAKAELMTIPEYARIVAGAQSRERAGPRGKEVPADFAQQLGNEPPGTPGSLRRTRYVAGQLYDVVRVSPTSKWTATIRERPSTAARQREFARHRRERERKRASAMDTMRRWNSMGRGAVANDYFRRRRNRQRYGIPEGGYVSASERAWRSHVNSAQRSGAYVEFTGPNSVYIDRTSKAGERAYWMNRVRGRNSANYAMYGEREPIPGYDVNDPHRDAYTGYRKGNGAYSRGMNAYYDRMGGAQYMRDQANLRGRYTAKMMGEYTAMVEEFKNFGPRFRNHPRHGSSYRKWDEMLKRYGGRFPDQYAYLTEFRTQIQAYRKANEVEGHMESNREDMEQRGIKGEKYIPIPASPSARWRSLTVSISKRNPDGTISRFVYHPGVVEQFDASRDLEGMIAMGIDIERRYSLIGDRDGKKKLIGVNLRFVNDGVYSVDVVSDGYRRHYEVPVGTDTASERNKEREKTRDNIRLIAPFELDSEAGILNIKRLGDRLDKPYNIGQMKVGEEMYGEYGIIIRRVAPSKFGKHAYQIWFSEKGTYNVECFYQRGGNRAFKTEHTVLGTEKAQKVPPAPKPIPPAPKPRPRPKPVPPKPKPVPPKGPEKTTFNLPSVDEKVPAEIKRELESVDVTGLKDGEMVLVEKTGRRFKRVGDRLFTQRRFSRLDKDRKEVFYYAKEWADISNFAPYYLEINGKLQLVEHHQHEVISSGINIHEGIPYNRNGEKLIKQSNNLYKENADDDTAYMGQATDGSWHDHFRIKEGVVSWPSVRPISGIGSTVSLTSGRLTSEISIADGELMGEKLQSTIWDPNATEVKDIAAQRAELKKVIPLMQEALNVYESGKVKDALAKWLEIQKQFDHEVVSGMIMTLYNKLGKADKAFVEMEDFLRKNPNNSWSQNRVAWAIAVRPTVTSAQAKRAVELAQAAIKSDPKNANIHDTLAAAYAAAGEFDKAVASQGDAIVLDADNKEFTERLALYKARKRYIEGTKPEKPEDPKIIERNLSLAVQDIKTDIEAFLKTDFPEVSFSQDRDPDDSSLFSKLELSRWGRKVTIDVSRSDDGNSFSKGQLSLDPVARPPTKEVAKDIIRYLKSEDGLGLEKDAESEKAFYKNDEGTVTGLVTYKRNQRGYITLSLPGWKNTVAMPTAKDGTPVPVTWETTKELAGILIREKDRAETKRGPEQEVARIAAKLAAVRKIATDSDEHSKDYKEGEISMTGYQLHASSDPNLRIDYLPKGSTEKIVLTIEVDKHNDITHLMTRGPGAGGTTEEYNGRKLTGKSAVEIAVNIFGLTEKSTQEAEPEKPEKPKPLLEKAEIASLVTNIEKLGLKGITVEETKDAIVVTRTVGTQKFTLSFNFTTTGRFPYIGSITDTAGKTTILDGPSVSPDKLVTAKNILAMVMVKENKGKLMTQKELEDLLNL